jgi:hypothetical protein
MFSCECRSCCSLAQSALLLLLPYSCCLCCCWCRRSARSPVPYPGVCLRCCYRAARTAAAVSWRLLQHLLLQHCKEVWPATQAGGVWAAPFALCRVYRQVANPRVTCRTACGETCAGTKIITKQLLLQWAHAWQGPLPCAWTDRTMHCWLWVVAPARLD